MAVADARILVDDAVGLMAYEAGLPPRPDSGMAAEDWDRAMDGDARAQFNLGWAYEHGLGVERSRDKCMRWYEESCGNGDRNALLALGNIAWGTRATWFEQSVELLEKGCRDGLGGAMGYLGMIHRSGYGLEADPSKAVE